ncbi:MAG: type III pantothenate kinase, partial [Akkermansiaceae bacterium]|nr:type III pantothenate kinase [Akkermansiaceae bacterium]
PPGRMATGAVSVAAVREVTEPMDFDAAVLCSVVPAAAVVIREALAAPLHEISHRSALPIGIDYPEPGQIGADRLANAVAVHEAFGAPAVVIDFGTAVTFDVVGVPPAGRGTGAPGSYLGGVIAPGLASLTDYLADHTALLPHVDLEEPKSAIGKSTTAAMRAGAVIGYRGMIREILAAVTVELGGDPRVVATGGDAALIAAGLREIHEVVPDLTLRGIDLVGRRNL